MAGKITACILLILCVFMCSCYPELSVQQYDKLKEDLVELDEQRNVLEAELASVTEELETIKTSTKDIRMFVDFLAKLVSTQSSEMLLVGEFDTEALIEAKDELVASGDKLGDEDISYYLTLIDPENEDQTVAVYYKIIEYCLKNIKEKLTVSS